MFNETVAQKPTTPVSEGMKKRKNSLKLWNFDGVASMGPKPPALLRAQRRRASPMSSRNGAEMPCKKRMVSIPRRITDRKSTRLNSSHSQISYAVFCLKKKKQYNHTYHCTHATTPMMEKARHTHIS